MKPTWMTCSVACLAALLAAPTARGQSSPHGERWREIALDSAITAWKKNQLATACSFFASARRASRHPSLILNSARCEERRGNRAAALAAYREFLATSPDPAEAREAEK